MDLPQLSSIYIGNKSFSKATELSLSSIDCMLSLSELPQLTTVVVAGAFIMGTKLSISR